MFGYWVALQLVLLLLQQLLLLQTLLLLSLPLLLTGEEDHSYLWYCQKMPCLLPIVA